MERWSDLQWLGWVRQAGQQVLWTKADCFSFQGPVGWLGLSRHHPVEAQKLGLGGGGVGGPARNPLQSAGLAIPHSSQPPPDAHLRPFSCTYCNSRFKTRQHLTQHQRLHTGEKPYACNHCWARFTQMTPLKRHIAKFHLDVTLQPQTSSSVKM